MLEDYLHTRPRRPSNYPEGAQSVTGERGAEATTMGFPDVETNGERLMRSS